MKLDDDRLSVLIISFNCWEDIDRCLRTIEDSDYPSYELVVIDNASVDGTPEKIEAKYPYVKVVRNNHNAGHVLAVNQGLRLLRGDKILLLDADTELERDAIRLMSDFLSENREAWMIAPKTLNTDGTVQKTARNFPSPMNGLFGRQSLLSRIFPKNPFTRRYLNDKESNGREPFAVEFISAACMMFRRSILDEVGFWDEGYKGYWVDADWCKRIQKADGKIYCVPRAVIKHHEQNKGFRRKNPRRIIDFHAGAFRFYRKHYTLGPLDPRSLLAGLLLGSRAAILLLINSLVPSHAGKTDPLSMRKTAP